LISPNANHGVEVTNLGPKSLGDGNLILSQQFLTYDTPTIF
jgi:hypothetical protein